MATRRKATRRTARRPAAPVTNAAARLQAKADRLRELAETVHQRKANRYLQIADRMEAKAARTEDD